MKELQSNKNWVKEYNQLAEMLGDLEVLFEFEKEGEATVEEVDQNYGKVLAKVEDLSLIHI